MANKKKNRKQQTRQNQRQRQRMGNQVAAGAEAISRSASTDDGDTTVSEGELPRLPRLRLSDLTRLAPEQSSTTSGPLQQQSALDDDDHQARVVAELSERFLLTKSFESSSLHSHGGAAALVPTDEPTTRTCSPTPSCCYSEEGQEVVADPGDLLLGAATGDLSSIDTTGADVNLALESSTPNSPHSSLNHLQFLEEKKDEDNLGFASSPSDSSLSPRHDHHTATSDDDDEHDDTMMIESPADNFNDDDRPSSAIGSPYPRGSLMEGSADDSGFFTASQSDITTRPTSAEPNAAAAAVAAAAAATAEGLALASSHSLPHLEDEAGSDDAEADDEPDTTPRTKHPSTSSRVRIRRRSDYDSVVSTLQSHASFASARHRLERHSLTGEASPTASPDELPHANRSSSPSLRRPNTNYYSSSPRKPDALETTLDTAGTSMTVPDDEDESSTPEPAATGTPVLMDVMPTTNHERTRNLQVTVPTDSESPAHEECGDPLGEASVDRSTPPHLKEGGTATRELPNDALSQPATSSSVVLVPVHDESSAVPSSAEANRLKRMSEDLRESFLSSVSSESSPPCPSSAPDSIDASKAPNTCFAEAVTVTSANSSPTDALESKATQDRIPSNSEKEQSGSSVGLPPVDTNHGDSHGDTQSITGRQCPDGTKTAIDAMEQQSSKSCRSDPTANNPLDEGINSAPHESAESRDTQGLSLPDLTGGPGSGSATDAHEQLTQHEHRDASVFHFGSGFGTSHLEGEVNALHASFSSVSAAPTSLADTEAAVAAASAALKGDLSKTDKYESPKFVKTILGSPTLAERKAALYTPRKSGKRDPTAVLQLAERPAPMLNSLVAIESEDDDDCDVQDASSVTPRQLEKTLTLGGGPRSVTSCASRSLASEQDSPPNSPAPAPLRKSELRAKGTAPTVSLREGLRRIDSAPIGTVISKESGEGASVASLPTPGPSSSPIIFRTPLSISKRQPSDPKRMSDLIRLDVWSRKPSVVESALESLSQYAADDKNHGTMARTGALLAIVRAMENHVDNCGIQVQACRCLEKLALDHENELAIGEVGGIEAILGAMMSHSENALVQEAAWAALWNLTCGNADHQLVVDAAGGIEVLVQCMMRHSDHPEVQKNACGTLANLCLDNEERLTALAEADGFVAISMALQKHWRNPDVRNEASYALTILLGPRAETYDVPVAHLSNR